MKNIINYRSDKYANDSLYSFVEDGIYEYENPPQVTYTALERLLKLNGSHGFRYKYAQMFTHELQPKFYVSSLSFEQELDLGEGKSPSDISQYPLEDILDTFGVYISDFYTKLNQTSKKTCYQEFASRNLDDVKNLRSIIGKHVYERPTKKDKELLELVIE